MRITLVSADFWPNVGGVAAHVLELGRSLVQRGHEVDVVSRPSGTEQDAIRVTDGLRILRPRYPWLRPGCQWTLHLWLKSRFAESPTDVVHVHGLRPLPACGGLDVPLVFTNHTSGFLKRVDRGRLAHYRVGRWLRGADAIIAPSQELCEATRLVGVTGRVDYIPNGVDTDRFCPGSSETRALLGIRPDEVVVLLARRLVAKNGVCVFAEAVEKFAGPGIRIVIAGDGPERPEVERLLTASGHRSRCLLLGNVANSEMPGLYRAADISVLPSFQEATSITGLESMATALPVVGTRVGGIPELIINERTGLLVDPGRPDLLAGAIRELIDDPDRRRQYGRRGRLRAMAEFSWDAVARQTEAVYQSVVGGSPSPPLLEVSRLPVSPLADA